MIDAVINVEKITAPSEHVTAGLQLSTSRKQVEDRMCNYMILSCFLSYLS